MANGYISDSLIRKRILGLFFCSLKKMKHCHSCLKHPVKEKGNFSGVCKFSFCYGKCWGPCSVAISLLPANCRTSLKCFQKWTLRLSSHVSLWRSDGCRTGFSVGKEKGCYAHSCAEHMKLHILGALRIGSRWMKNSLHHSGEDCQPGQTADVILMEMQLVIDHNVAQFKVSQ